MNVHNADGHHDDQPMACSDQADIYFLEFETKLILLLYSGCFEVPKDILLTEKKRFPRSNMKNVKSKQIKYRMDILVTAYCFA